MVAAVYRHIGHENDLLYVGVSAEPFRRQREHAASSRWFPGISRVDFDWFEDKRDAQTEERRAITFDAPQFNQRRASWPDNAAVGASPDLNRYLSDRRMLPCEFGRISGYSPTTIEGWLNGKSLPSRKVMLSIQAATSGAVPASSWREAS
tara:strand:- start:42395 stop:42844 length:450 start_codon:yes stop_codon:yes gene_type:complete